MSFLDDLIKKGEAIGDAADRLGTAAHVKSLWILARRALDNGELEERVGYYLDIASAAAVYVPSPAGAAWFAERDVFSALAKAYALCASNKESVAWLPRMDTARNLILRLAALLESAPDADARWWVLLDDDDAYYAEALFRHVMRADAAQWTTLAVDEHRRVASLHHRLFRRVIERPGP